ncbi:hypothetical protein Ddye_003249 [Dipteronia dyeriana]|uniref:Uncharacterized protein n=1 Tax=Dipteronia dyeriana TaxID=168575 RepID=A0AAE0CV47_9ROSI|nr:hypothetical protein Ddye_003249 [Dipteronia dyeriana]
MSLLDSPVEIRENSIQFSMETEFCEFSPELEDHFGWVQLDESVKSRSTDPETGHGIDEINDFCLRMKSYWNFPYPVHPSEPYHIPDLRPPPQLFLPEDPLRLACYLKRTMGVGLKKEFATRKLGNNSRGTREEGQNPQIATDNASLERAVSLLDRRGGASPSMGQRIKRFDFVPGDPPQVGFD